MKYCCPVKLLCLHWAYCQNAFYSITLPMLMQCKHLCKPILSPVLFPVCFEIINGFLLKFLNRIEEEEGLPWMKLSRWTSLCSIYGSVAELWPSDVSTTQPPPSVPLLLALYRVSQIWTRANNPLLLLQKSAATEICQLCLVVHHPVGNIKFFW